MNKWIMMLIQNIINSMSGPLRDSIIASVRQWEVAAKETADPWDDLIVGVAKFLLGIP